MMRAGLRRPVTGLAIVLTAVFLAACDRESLENRKDPLGKNVIDDANLTDMMLTAGSPDEAIRFFEKALAEEPDRADYRRGLAISLTRAKRYPEAARVYEELIALNQSDPTDRLEYAVVAARLERWDQVRSILGALPDGLNSARRHMVDAMLSDHDQDWAASDAAYSRAEKLSNNPASVLNNWGVSMMSRGDLPAAEKLFEKSLSFNSRLFSAKNNLAIARGLQGNYQLPVVPMTETEKAIMLNNLGVIAVRRGEAKIAKGLFVAAVETHPQHYEEAAGRLSALEAVVEN